MKKKYIWLLLILFTALGCFDDKGNYDYKELNKITFENIPYNNSIYFGDPLDIVPKLKFALDSVNVNLKYEWRHLEDVIATTPELHIEHFEYYAGKASTLYYRVEDVDNQMLYIYKFLVTVAGTYQNGWLILAEKDNKSSLSMIKINKQEDEAGNVTRTYSLDTDIYNNINDGELGSQPIKLHEHFNADVFRTKGQIMIAQQSGSVELEGSSLAKVVDTEKEFVGDKYPQNFTIKDMAYTYAAGYLLSNDGKVYYRNNASTEEYQSGRFFSMPKKDLETGKDLNCSRVLLPNFNDSRSLILLDKIDDQRSRMVFLSDNPYYGDRSGIQLTDFVLAPGATMPEDFTPLDNIDKEVRFWGWHTSSTSTTDVISILKDRNDNQYYFHKFDYEINWDDAVEYTPRFEKLFVGNDLVTDKTIFRLSRGTPFLYFTSGANNNELYYCTIDELTTGYEKVKIPFNDAITSVEVNLEGDVLGIGLNNGEFYLIDADNLREEGILFHAEANQNIGKIVDCIYKIGNAWNAQSGSEDY